MSASDSDPGFNPQNYAATQLQYNNQGFNSASALSIRLDTQTVVDNFRVYLKGKDVATVLNPNTNKPEVVVLYDGEPIKKTPTSRLTLSGLLDFDGVVHTLSLLIEERPSQD